MENKKLTEGLIMQIKDIDSLSEAEKITGKSYKNDKDTSLLGFHLMQNKSQVLDKLLSEVDDTKFVNKISDYLRIAQKNGFEQIYKEDFVHTPDYGEKKPHDEKLYCLFNYTYGILIVFDTYFGNVNSCHFYYNFMPNYEASRFTSSGGYMTNKNKELQLFSPDMVTPYEIPNFPDEPSWNVGEPYKEYKERTAPVLQVRKEMMREAQINGYGPVWSGYHDGREGLITTINYMLTQGKFYPKWHTCPFSWITTYADHKGGNHSYPYTGLYELTRKRLAQFPKDVLDRLAQYRQD